MYKLDLTGMTLSEIMDLPLPLLSVQKKFGYRPTQHDVDHVYHLLNEHIYYKELNKPTITLASRCRSYWGMCYGEDARHLDTYSHCNIKLMDKWYCPQWMVMILAHEMAHQYQWDVEGPWRDIHGQEWLMAHGPTFFSFKNRLAEYKIPLKTAHYSSRWFEHQDLFKT